jgi:hypothetical protein
MLAEHLQAGFVLQGVSQRLGPGLCLDSSVRPEFHDPADWNPAGYTADPKIDSIEPLPDHSTSCRDAALACLRILPALTRS